MKAIRVVTALLVLLVVPILAAAQGLGDAAKRERQRRTQEGQPKAEPRVYSNEDLDEGRPAGSTQQTQAGAEAAVSGATPRPGGAPSAEDDGSTALDRHNEREKQFEAAIEAARARVREIEEHARKLEAQLDPASPTFVYRPGSAIDLQAADRIRAELQEQPARLEEAKRALAAAEDALLGFKRGDPNAVPPGQAPDAGEPAEPTDADGEPAAK